MAPVSNFPRIRAGQLRNLIQIVSPSRVQDAAGGLVPGEGLVFTTANADIQAIDPRSEYSGLQITPEVTHLIIMRYEPGIRGGMVVLWTDGSPGVTTAYDVVDALDPDKHRHALYLKCTERADSMYSGYAGPALPAGPGEPALIPFSDSGVMLANLPETTIYMPAKSGMIEVFVSVTCTAAGSAGTLSTTLYWTNEAGAQSLPCPADISLTGLNAGDSQAAILYAVAGYAVQVGAVINGGAGSPSFRVRVRVVPLD